MTTIAYRDGFMASDSRVTVETEAGGIRHFKCEKLYRVTSPSLGECVVGLAGESAPGLVFLDWLQSEKPELVDRLIEGGGDFTALVLCRKGLYEYDGWCRGEKVLERFYAIGSGCKAALGAMHMGATARTAVKIACRIDTLSAPRIVTMALEKAPARRRAARPTPRTASL
jgi:ATP-dependent protease HslVU (ClpYQ) peptidase subunit